MGTIIKFVINMEGLDADLDQIQNRLAFTRFLFDAISHIDRSWRLPSSYSRHVLPLPMRKHATISQQARQQVIIIKTRKSYQ